MDWFSVLAFAGVALTLIAVPGPSWAFILTAGVRDRMVLPAVAGLTMGCVLVAVVTALGLEPLITASPLLLSALTIAGAAYLCYLGVETLSRPGRFERNGDGNNSPQSRPGQFLAKGLAVSALNPKGLLIFVAVLPQFTRSDQGWPIVAQLALLGAVYTVICGLFFLFLGYTADRVLGSRPRIARIATQAAGLAMIVVGLIFLIERVAEIVSQ
jgi:threonine/homoserine/homoserine lactone efflux protein